MEDKISDIFAIFSKEISSTKNIQNLEKIKSQYLGKSSTINSLFKEIKKISPEQRANAGQKINNLRDKISKELESKSLYLKKKILKQQTQKEWVDISLDVKQNTGALHPLSSLQYKLEDIFLTMGFTVLDGNHIESDFYNFAALNIPKDHPSRDLQDTYYFNEKFLLRTQTSPLQIRAMEKQNPPIRIIAPGKVFRSETRDASHENCFHQLEGMVVDKGISVSHLLYFMETMLSKIFMNEVKVRFASRLFSFCRTRI